MEQYKSTIKNIEKQVRFWDEKKNKIELPQILKEHSYKESLSPKTDLPFVTISREYGSGGYIVGEKLAEILNKEYKFKQPWAAYDKKILEKVMSDFGLNQPLINTLTDHARASLTEALQTTFSNFPTQVSIHKKLVETIILLAKNGNVIIIGRGGSAFTSTIPNGFHVRIAAPLEWRAEKVSESQNISKADAKKLILDKTKDREGYMNQYIKHDLYDSSNFHLLINNSRFSTEQAARLIIEGMRLKGLIGDNG